MLNNLYLSQHGTSVNMALIDVTSRMFIEKAQGKPGDGFRGTRASAFGFRCRVKRSTAKIGEPFASLA